MKNLQRMFLVGAVALTTMHARADIASLEHALATCRAHIAAGKLISGEDVAAVEALVDLADAVGQDNLSASHTQALGEVLVWAAQAEPETRNKLNKIFNNVFIRGLLEVNSLAVDADAAVGGDLTVDGNITLKGQLFTQSTSGAIPIEVIDGDTGSVTGQTIQFTALPTAGQTVSFDGSGSTMTLNFSSGGNTFLGSNVGTPASGAFTGQTNIAIGGDATTMSSLTSGNNNIALGYHAAEELSDGTGNICIGVFAGQDLSTGSFNTCLGNSSGFLIGAGANNTYIGYHAGQASAGGNNNVFVGNNAGAASTSTTGENTFVGSSAGIALVSGSNNTLVGFDVGHTAATGNNNTVIGNEAWFAATAGTANTIIGNSAGVNILTGISNTIIGNAAGYGYVGAEGGNTVIGAGINGVAGESNVVRIGSAGALSYLDDANEAIFIGRTAGTGTYTVGTPIVSIGDGAANSVTTGGGVFVGHNAGAVVTTGIQNTLIGNEAGSAVSTAAGNTFVGYNAGHLATAANNTMLGASAGAAVTTGAQNTLVGSGSGALLTTGTGNVFIGYDAGNAVTTGNSNICLGSLTTVTSASANQNILIGWNIPSSQPNAGFSGNNNIVIGSLPNDAQFQNTGGNWNIIGPNANWCVIGGITTQSFSGATAVYVYNTNVGATINGTVCLLASAERFKTDIKDMDDFSSGIMQLKPKTFRPKASPEILDAGLIADEVREIVPHLAFDDADGQPLGVHYDRLPALLLNELQKLYARVTKLESAQQQ